MRQQVLHWAAGLVRGWWRNRATFAAVPDPHGQFPAIPLDWYSRDVDDQPRHVHVPAQRTGPDGGP